MAAGPIGPHWATGSWPDTGWEAGSWGFRTYTSLQIQDFLGSGQSSRSLTSQGLDVMHLAQGLQPSGAICQGLSARRCLAGGLSASLAPASTSSTLQARGPRLALSSLPMCRSSLTSQNALTGAVLRGLHVTGVRVAALVVTDVEGV